MDVESLLPYQQTGAEWLARMHQALLADEMGLGKTGQAIVACDLVAAGRVLVICPAAARFNWLREFERFSPFDRPVRILGGTAVVSAHGRGAVGVDVCSFDYASAPSNVRELREQRWDVLVIDEAHYLKNKDSTRTYAIYKYLAPASLRVWRLSGTPSPNGRPDELWAHLASASITDLALPAFIARYCAGYESPYGFRVTGPRADTLPELKALLARMTLRRTIAEVAPELPPISHETFVVEPGPVDEELWFLEQTCSPVGRAQFLKNLKEANDQLKAMLKMSGSPAARLGVLESLAQSTPISMLRRYVGLSKCPAIVEILKAELDADPTMKIVLFAAHRSVIEQLYLDLKPYGAVMFFGGQTPGRREKNKNAFRDDPKCRVFIGHIVAAGTAIDGLQNQCREVGIVEPSWVPGENAQAVMRVHRRGVKGSVRVRWFSCGGSIDEQINDSLRKKSEDQLKILA